MNLPKANGLSQIMEAVTMSATLLWHLSCGNTNINNQKPFTMAKTTVPQPQKPQPKPQPKPNPNYPSKNPGKPSGPERGNEPKKK